MGISSLVSSLPVTAVYAAADSPFGSHFQYHFSVSSEGVTVTTALVLSALRAGSLTVIVGKAGFSGVGSFLSLSSEQLVHTQAAIASMGSIVLKMFFIHY